MTTHAKLSASGSDRWLTCTGSVKAESNLPNTTSSFAIEGTTAHALAEICLTENCNPSDFIGQDVEGYPVNDEMADHVAAYVAYVKSFSGVHLYEQRVDFSEWIPNGFGTSDAIVIDESNKTCHVIDLKYGKGVIVDAENNSQGMLYALGTLSQFGYLYDFDNIVIHIYQPRVKNYSSWQVTTDALLKWAEWAKQRAEEALSDNAPRTPTDKGCTWCKAKSSCKALAEHSLKVIMSDFDDLEDLTPIDSINQAQTRLILDNAKLIKSWLDAIESRVMQQLLNGETFDGYKLVEGRSIRKWQDESTATELLLKHLPNDQVFTQKLITPAQAEKLMKKEKNLLSDLIIKPEGAPALVKSDDKRKAKNELDDFDTLD